MSKLHSADTILNMGIQTDAPHLEQLQLRLLNLDLFISLSFSIAMLALIALNFSTHLILVGVSVALVLIYVLAVLLSYKSLHNIVRPIRLVTPILIITFFHFYLGSDCFFQIILLGASLTTLIYGTMPKLASAAFFALHLVLFIIFSLFNTEGVLPLSDEWSLIVFRINIVVAVLTFIYEVGMLRYLYSSLVVESKSSALHYQRLFEDNLVGLLITDDQFNITKTNKAFQEMLKYSEKELMGISLAQITAPEYLEDCRLKMMKMAKGEMNECTMEKAYSMQDSSLFYSQTFLRRFKQKESENSGYIISVLDMNEHLKSKNALRESEEKFRDIFENVTDGIITLDNETYIVNANKAAYETFGIEPGKKVRVKDIVYKPDSKKSNKYFRQLVERGSYTGYQGRILTPKKGVRHIEVNSSGIFDRKGNLIGSRDIVRDITEQKEQEEVIQLKMKELNDKNEELKKYIKSNMQLENFAHIASHDLKAPLRTIISFSQLLERSIKTKLSARESEYLEFIINATQNMHLLVDDLLAYSKVNSSPKELQKIPFDSLLKGLLAELQSSITEKNAEIIIDNQVEYIIADRIKIRQILQNLIANAIKFHKPDEQPKVQIKAKEKELVWQFSVSDNGIGIKKEFYEKVFMLFRKLNPIGKYQGSGIGLAICKLIVEQHGGNIWIESIPNEGTTFYFTLSKEKLPACENDSSMNQLTSVIEK
ncbi:MAG: PAS domain S-box protein [Saprospiraceae bacterium]